MAAIDEIEAYLDEVFPQLLLDGRIYRVEAVGHMKYYGHVSLDLKLSFVAETVAYDVCALCMLAHELGFAREPQISPHQPHWRMDSTRPLSIAIHGTRCKPL